MQGPDTGGQWWYVRSVDSSRPTDDESRLGWTMQLFRIPGGLGSTPASFAPSTLIGEAKQVSMGEIVVEAGFQNQKCHVIGAEITDLKLHS